MSKRMEFINELKRYNSGKEREAKVRLLVWTIIVSRNSAQNSAIDIFDFVVHLNREWKDTGS